MAKFSKGQDVKFYVNTNIKSDKSIVSAVIANESKSKSIQQYVVEFNNGWKPNKDLAGKYLLDENKKYIFVFEIQVTAI